MHNDLDLHRDNLYQYLAKKYKRAVISKSEMADEYNAPFFQDQ